MPIMKKVGIASIFSLFCILVLCEYRPSLLFSNYDSIGVSIYLDANETGFIQLFFDKGEGIDGEHYAVQDLYGTGYYSLEVRPHGSIERIRIDPINHRGRLVFESLEINWFGHRERLDGERLLKRLYPSPNTHLSLVKEGVLVECLDDDPQLYIYQHVDYSKYRALKDPRVLMTYLILLVLTGAMLTIYWQQCAPSPLDVEWQKTGYDPLRLLALRKKDVITGAIFLALGANILFFAVVWCDHTMVSAPMYNFPGEPYRDVVDGRGYNLDPGAGSTIEAPGLWFTHKSLIEEGEVPLWNPYEGAGQPYVADGEVAALSILQFPLHIVTPSIRAWNLFVVVRSYLAAFFMLLWLLSLGLVLPAAVIGAVGFAFTGLFVFFANLVHLNSVVFVPLMFLAAEGLMTKVTWWRFVFLSLATALCINGGNPQPFTATAIFLSFRLFQELRQPFFLKKASAYVAALGAGILLTAPTIFPLIELLRHSASRGINGNNLVQFTSWTPLSLLRPGISSNHVLSVFCHFWLGYFVGILALLGFIFGGTRLVLYRICAIVYLLIGVNVPFISDILGRLVNGTPILSSLFFSKYISPLTLVLCSMAAIFTDKIYSYRPGKVAVILPPLILLELLYSYPHFPKNQYDFSRNPLRVTTQLQEKLTPLFRFSGDHLLLTPYVSSFFKLQDIRTVTPLPLRSYKRFSILWAKGSEFHYLLTDDGHLSFNNKCLDFIGVKYFVTTKEIKRGPYTGRLSFSEWGGQLFNKEFKGFKISPGFQTFKGQLEGDWYVNTRGRLIVSIAKTKGFTLFLNKEKFYFDSPGEKKIDLAPFIGQVVHVLLYSPGPTTIKISVSIETDLRSLHWRPAFKNGIFHVYENERAKPIVRFADRVEFSRPPAFGIDSLCGETIFIEGVGGEFSRDTNGREKGDGKILSFAYSGLNSATIHLLANRPGWVFIAINNDGNWAAYLDNHKIPIFKAQGSFMAIPIHTTGRHIIELHYAPLSFFIGVVVAFAMFFSLCIISLYLVQKRSKSPKL